ncbi:MAG: hypothetical protein OXH69_13545 [Acidobacteria bacterium]|nr:hypothetical protein [Acidobacteriota bacterium]
MVVAVVGLGVSVYGLQGEEANRFRMVDARLARLGADVRAAAAASWRRELEVWAWRLGTGSSAASRFWKRFRDDLDSTAETRTLMPWVVLQALAENVVMVPTNHTGLLYAAMDRMLECMEEREEYLATMELSELQGEASVRFFESEKLSRRYRIRRIVLAREEEIRALGEKEKQVLRAQLELGIELSFGRALQLLRMNFGVYGGIAVGEMDRDRRCNVFTFEADSIENRRTDWRRLQQRSRVLTKDLLT